MTRLLGALTVGAVFLLIPRSITAAQPSEYDVKAAYIFNLLPFTTWPPTAFRSPAAPFTICVAEPDPFGSVLKETFQNERVADHPVVVTDITSPGGVGGCQVLFVGASADADGAIQQAAAAAPVLTIGEARQFARRGGMITFVIESGRIRFDVNETSATHANIQLSSKVLQVARKVS